MGTKKGAAPPPPPPPAASADWSSSSDDEELDRYVAKPNPHPGSPGAENSGSDSDSDSDSDSESEKEKETAKKNPAPSGGGLRIWSLKDEIFLLEALSKYKAKHGNLPSPKDYPSFLSSITASLSFPVTQKQLSNKIRTFKFVYAQKKNQGHAANFSQPHDLTVFKMCNHLFQDLHNHLQKRPASNPPAHAGNETPSKKKNKKKKANGSESKTETDHHTANENGNVVAVSELKDGAKLHVYLDGLIRDMISTQKCPTWCPTVDDMVARVGESRVRELEAKAKMLTIDKIKMREREMKLVAELFDVIADDMVED